MTCRRTILPLFFCLTGAWLLAGETPGETAITVYNDDFAVVREVLPIRLKPGENHVSFADATAHLEPDSVILRDPAGKISFRILEQNYRADPVSQNLLLSYYEGETIEFLVRYDDAEKIVKGRIIRSGYVPHASGLRRYGRQYAQTQMAHAYGAAGQPVIEVEGKLRFSLPGQPLFPALKDETILKPTLSWTIASGEEAEFGAELAYVTGGMSWEADYNVLAPEEGDVLDLIGWITLDNQSGKSFDSARVKLMAGDVNKIQEGEEVEFLRARAGMEAARRSPVEEKAFDEFHLYTIHRPTTLRDRETKQIEFVRAGGVKSTRLYIYDGAQIPSHMRRWNFEQVRSSRQYGQESNPKIWVMREFENSAANGLGMPLPKGRMRFYRLDTDGRLEFTGENVIDHTPKDETVRVYVGNAFDIVGERKQTAFDIDNRREELDESFEIRLRNHKTEPVEVRVVEHLYRGKNWEITKKSDEYVRTDSRTVEFRLPLRPDEETILTYTVHYTW